MKKGCIALFLLIMVFLLIGCENANVLTIEGSKTLEMGYSEEYKVFYNGKELSEDDYLWTIGDRTVLYNNGNTFTPLKEGICDIIAVLKEDGTIVAKYTVTVIDALIKSISIYSSEGTKVYINDFLNLEYKINPSDVLVEATWSTSDESIASIDQDGLLTAHSKGVVTVYVKCGKAIGTLDINVKEKITEIVSKIPNEISVGQGVKLSFNIDDPVYTIKDDSKNEYAELIDDVLFAKKEGTIKLNVKSKSEPTLSKNFEFKIVANKSNTINYDYSAYTNQLNDILSKMSITQKIGQYAFVSTGADDLKEDTDGVYYNDTNSKIPGKKYISELFGEREFGNFIFSNIDNRDPLNSLSYFQKIAIYNSQIGGLTMIVDSTAESLSTLTTQISTIGLGNLKPDQFSQYVTNYAKELKELGVNCYYTYGFDTFQYYDKFSKDTVTNNYYSTLLVNALKKQGIMTGFLFEFSYTYARDQERLIEMVNNDVDMIGITDNPDNFYENQSLVSYLRNTLNYKGLIYLDSTSLYNTVNIGDQNDAFVEDPTVESTNIAETIIKAINDGIDLINAPITINYRSWYQPAGYNEQVFALYDAIIEAYNNKKITEETINNAVSRIVLAKLKYNMIEGTEVAEELSDYTEYNEYAKSLYKDTYTLSENYQGLDKNKKTVIIGTKFRINSYYSRGEQVDFATSMKNTLDSLGYADSTTIVNPGKNFDSQLNTIKTTNDVQVVFCLTYSEYSYSYKDETTQYVSFQWADKIKELYDAGVTNITVVLLYNSDIAEAIPDIKNIVYANYTFTNNFAELIDLVIDGK